MVIRIPRFGIAVVLGWLLCAAAASAASPWVLVSDIHLEAAPDGVRPASYGTDTNAALFAGALREMKAVSPDPPVVIVSGDLLAHDMDRAHATGVAVAIARAFDRIYPRAQFILTLGNNDSDCGDYGLTPDSAFLRAVGAAWAPLVNRNGAAPQFAKTFAHDGFYVAKLPLPGTRAVVVDDAFWSPRYRAGCGRAGRSSAMPMTELEHALTGPPQRTWLFLHIPPGIDAFSTTHLTHRLAVVPFLDPGPREKLVTLIGDPARRVTLVVAAHTHKFAYRLVDVRGRAPTPVLLVPAISPVFGNAPSFLTARVDADAVPSDVEEISYLGGRWRRVGGFPSLGVSRLTGEALAALQARLERDPQLRRRFAALYNGDAPPEIDAANWRSYWCAATAFSATRFRGCTDQGGLSVFTTRALLLVGGAPAGVLLIAAVAMLAFWLVRRRRTAG